MILLWGILLPSPAPWTTSSEIVLFFPNGFARWCFSESYLVQQGWCSFEILSSLWCENSAKAWKGWRWWCCCGPCVQLGRHENFLFQMKFWEAMTGWPSKSLHWTKKISWIGKRLVVSHGRKTCSAWTKHSGPRILFAQRSNMHMTGCTVVSLMVPFRWSYSGFSSLWEKNLGNFLKTTWNIGTFPSTSRSASWKLCFPQKRWSSYKKQGKFSCQASEALTLIPILSFWLKAIFLKDAQLRPFCEAFLWCMDVILLLSEGQKSCLTTKQNLQAAVAKCFAGMVSAGWHKNMPPKFHWQWHFGRWTCTPWKMHCMFCYRKKAQGAEQILCSKGEYPVLWAVLHGRDIGRGACHSDGARPLSAGACFDKGASTYKEACSIPHQDFRMWWWSCLQLCCSQTSGRQSIQRWCGSSEEPARWARSRTSLGFYWSTWLSLAAWWTCSSWSSTTLLLAQLCGRTQAKELWFSWKMLWHQWFIAYLQKASELCCHGIGTNQKALEKETQMSLCRLLQNSLKRLFVITAF